VQTRTHDSHAPALHYAPDGRAGRHVHASPGRLVQVGTPEEIYTRPATPFVARFTGLAGELPVRVRDRGENGTVLVELEAGQAFRARAPIGALASEEALVMIRPRQAAGCLAGTG
jgi:ABC-type Fe3+/spermidine/putrescine transport system ATPase subunit